MNKYFNNNLHKKILSNNSTPFISKSGLIFVVTLACFGTLLFTLSHASTPSVSIELEDGFVSGPAERKTDDSTASNNAYVEFGTSARNRDILWGIGDEIGYDITTPIYRDAPIDMVTQWFNARSDLDWMAGYSNPNLTLLSDLYGQGKSVELVIFLHDDPQYAISPQFQSDLVKLVNMYKGFGPNYGDLYVVVYTEVETYFGSGQITKEQLKTSYLQSVQTIHNTYNKSKVALGFGGYSWTDSKTTDLSFWNDAIAASDFTAVQAMQQCDTLDAAGKNKIIAGIRNSVHQLGTYGKPVMISHFQIWENGVPGCPQNAFAAFMDDLFTDASIADLKASNLFAWGFMTGQGERYLVHGTPSYNKAIQIINKY